MAMSFRSAGDIIFSDHEPIPGQLSDVQLKQFSETSNFLQCLEPLSPKYPFFYAKIRALSKKSQISIGIAGPDIAEDGKPGHWNNTVGYSGHKGRCTTSHCSAGNTKGEKFGIGDVFGVYVTHFGQQMSTVTFLKNDRPVATRYHFEADHSKFLPTITMENGPIDLAIMWPQAVMHKPNFSEKNMQHWILGKGISYDSTHNMFIDSHINTLTEVSTMQSPKPLCTNFQHYEVVVQQTDEIGAGPAVGIATCSPLKPTPTCELLRDFFRWMPDGDSNKTCVGQRIGLGVHYDPENRESKNFSDKEQQLVLCFVTVNATIVYVQMMMQPEGGFFPLVLLNAATRKLTVDVESNRRIESYKILDDLFKDKLEKARKMLENDALQRRLTLDMFRQSKSFNVEIPQQTSELELSKQYFRLKLPKSQTGIHVIQFKRALTEKSSYFCIEIKKLNEDSMITIGIADSSFPLNKHPGKLKNSTGYTSRDGKMFYNTQFDGNLLGERYEEGDTVGVSLSNFDKQHPVALFSKNNRPIGTRYVTINDTSQFLPTVAVSGNGYDLELDIYWQNQYLIGPMFDVHDPESWCLPKDADVDEMKRIITVKDHIAPAIIQCPRPLNVEKKFDFFEIELIDKFGDENDPPPPGIALASACFQDLTKLSTSNFRQDFVRFLPIGDAITSVEVGQKIGWGIIVPDSEKDKTEDRLLLCYLSIDRNIALTRVMYEPPGGFYPLLMLLGGINRVKLGTVMHIYSHPVSPEVCEMLISDARELIKQEKLLISEGKTSVDLDIDPNDLFRTLPDSTEPKTKDKAIQVANIALTARFLEKNRNRLKNRKDDNNNKSKTCVLL